MGVLAVERLHFKRQTLYVPNLMNKLLNFYSTSKRCIPLDIVKVNYIRLIWFDV